MGHLIEVITLDCDYGGTRDITMHSDESTRGIGIRRMGALKGWEHKRDGSALGAGAVDR
jgi:hypothetical protein